MADLEVLIRQLQTYNIVGDGDPEGAVPAPIGATFRRRDGGAATSLYVKEADDGEPTGWVGK